MAAHLVDLIGLGLVNAASRAGWPENLLSAARASPGHERLIPPYTNGVIMKGKMTTSRMGIMGSFFGFEFFLGSRH